MGCFGRGTVIGIGIVTLVGVGIRVGSIVAVFVIAVIVIMLYPKQIAMSQKSFPRTAAEVHHDILLTPNRRRERHF